MKTAWYSSQLKETKQTSADQNIHLSVLLQYIRCQWDILSLWSVVLWIKTLNSEKYTHTNGKKEYGIQVCPALQRLDLCHFTFMKDLCLYLFSLMERNLKRVLVFMKKKVNAPFLYIILIYEISIGTLYFQRAGETCAIFSVRKKQIYDLYFRKQY